MFDYKGFLQNGVLLSCIIYVQGDHPVYYVALSYQIFRIPNYILIYFILLLE